MALAFGTTLLDGTYTKSFTVTGLENDVKAIWAVVFDGGGAPARPNAFGNLIVPLVAEIHRIDATGAASEFATHTLSANGVTVQKLTAGAAAAAVSVQVTVRAIHPLDR